MGTLDKFHEVECPRCGLPYLFPLGDEQAVRLPIEGAMSLLATRGVDCYAKVCKNCAYVEFFAKLLVDGFRAEQRPDGSIGGRVTAAGGQRLLSVFVKHRNETDSASDFTVPISADRWLQLRTVFDSMTDSQLIEFVYPEPYRRAWKERVAEPFPPADLALRLRELIRSNP